MANANTNLMSFNPIRPTDSTRSTTRTKAATFTREKTAVKNFNKGEKSSQSQKSFGAELDKANAQVNQSQQNNGEVQTSENVDAESKAEVVKASTQGQSNTKQDAPQEQNQNLPAAENSLPVTEKIVDKAVKDVILNQSTANIATQNLTQAVSAADVDVETVPQNIFADVDENLISAIPTDIPKATVSAAENLSAIPANLNTEVPVINTDDNPFEAVEEVQNLATSADVAFYFASTPETLLTSKIPDADVDTENLMSIMPQTRDNKAQSMLDFLSGKTWQSPTQNNDSQIPTLQPTESTQEMPAQLQQSVTSALPIQPQFQSRQFNFKSINQAQVQSQLQAVTPELQAAQVQQPLMTPPQVEVPIQSTLIQPTLQAAQVQSPLMTNRPQVDLPIQSTFDNQPLQAAQVQSPLMTNRPQVDSPIMQTLPDNQPLQAAQVQQPLITTAPQVEIPIQSTLIQPTLQAAQVQQPLMTTTPQVEVPIQSTLIQPTLQAAQVQQPLMTTAPQVEVPIQSTLIQPTLQAAQVQSPLMTNQPQIQKQQFGGEIQPQVNSFQAQVDTKTVNRQAVNEFLNVEVQVEEQPITPLTPLQNMSRQFNQNQQSMQNFGQSAALNVEVEQQSAEQSTAGAENFTANLSAVNHTTQNQPTAQVQAPEMTQAPREDFNVPAQIVEQARMIRTAGNTEMVINLKPEHLGHLTLRVSVGTNGAVTASFYTDNAQVRAIIENTMVQLKQELSEQGIKVDNVEVYAGLNEDSLLNGQGQQAWQQNQNQRNRRGQIDMNAVEEELDALNPVTDNVSADGVDYKV